VELPGGVSPQLGIAELPLSHGKLGDDVDWSEGWQLDIPVVRRRQHVVVLHVAVGCVLCVGRSPVVASREHYNSEPTIY
jgi:hypothetical protein